MSSSPYPVLGDRPIDQWRVTELKDELKRRKLVTKGLKEDLVKRLDEDLRKEEDLNKAGSLGSVVQAEAPPGFEMAEIITTENSEVTATVTKEVEIDLRAQISCEQESDSLIVNEGINHGDSRDEKVDGNTHNLDINDSSGVQGVSDSDVTGLGGNQTAQVIADRTIEPASESMETVVAYKGDGLLDIGTQTESSDGKAQLDDDSKSLEALKGIELPDTGTQNENSDGSGSLHSLHGDSKNISSDMNNQVSKANHVDGYQVKCESISSETLLVIENNELKDNISANNVELELEVDPQMVPPLSGSDVGGKSLQVDAEQPQANMVSLEETGSRNAETVGVFPKKDGVDVDLCSSGKVNLDQSPSDDFMDEDVAETKQTVLMTDSEGTRSNAGKVEVSASEDEVLVDIVGEDASAHKKAFDAEEKNLSAMISVKRKLNDQISVGNGVGKKQRRWNPAGLKGPEAHVDDISTTPKNVVQQPFKGSLSMPDPSVSEEVPKECVVPPSANPPTNSLRIDRFLRPFTLKAVQDLLGKTGTVSSFWMDQIKTHCYVSYSSVDEAIGTRNAVYNLQWPPNGGRLLVAEFVDPQEVKVRLEAPPKAPAVAVKPGANVLPQPSPRPHIPKQQLPQQALPPPPPTLLNPPPLVRQQVPQPAREHLPVRERLILPPPPPLAEKAEAPILTLDDLFRKTKATPRIYYLPLSDEQVAVKLQAQEKTVRQYAGLALQDVLIKVVQEKLVC